MYTYFHYGDQSQLALQVSLGIICVFCVLVYVLSSKNPSAFVFRENFIESVLMKLSYLMIVWEDKTRTYIPFMETNHHLYYKCHWGSFVFFVFSHMFCRQKTLLYFVFRRNFIKFVLMKLSYIMIVGGRRKHAYLFPLWRPITIRITSVIEIICVFCVLAHVLSSKNLFAFRFFFFLIVCGTNHHLH